MRIEFSRGIFLSFVLALAWGCETNQNKSSSSHESVVDLGPFGSYVSEFQAKATALNSPVQITDLIIKFGPMSNPLERGYCEMASNKTPTIVLDQNYWNQSDEASRKSLLLHELGHCVLDRRHIPTLTNQGIPYSLMNPYTISGNVFTYNETHYWQELFSVRNDL